MRISEPAPELVVPLRAHLTSAGAVVAVAGRAPRRATVLLEVSCRRTPCTTQARADRRGRWKAVLPVVVPRATTELTIGAALLEDPAARVELRVAAAPPPPPRRGAPRLAVLGDSLAVGTQDLLPALLPEWDVSTLAAVGLRLGAGMALLDRTPVPSRPTVLVLSLFTNDDPTEVDALRAAVRASLDRLPPRGCAVWLTVARRRVGGRSYAAVNRALREMAADPALASRLIVADWARSWAAHPEWRAEDRVHATRRGYAGRARLIAAAASRCPFSKAS